MLDCIATTFAAPCAHNVSFHFPNRLLLVFGGLCLPLLLISHRAERKKFVVVYCLFSDMCVVAAAVAWHFCSHTPADTHREQSCSWAARKKNIKERAKKNVEQWCNEGVQWPAFHISQRSPSHQLFLGTRCTRKRRILHRQRVPALRTCFIGRFLTPQ